MSEATDMSEPASVVTVRVEVDRYIWKYINKSATYQHKVDAIGKESETSIADADAEDSDCVRELSVTGSEERVTAARTAVLQLVDECRQTVSTYTVQCPDADTDSIVNENSSVLDDPAAALVDVDSGAGMMRLTGTKDEINHALGLLEVLGVPVPMPNESPAQSTVVVDEAPLPSLQLWKEQEEQEQEEDNIYAPQHSDSPAPVVVDAKLWKYLQKSNGQWIAEITDVREMGIVITESLTADGAVSLALAGIDDDIVEATERMRQLVDRCRSVVQTVDVNCPDSAVHAKVLKFMSVISKLPAYVAVESDERLTATGTSDELDECSNKLTKLGASLARVGDAADHPSSGGRMAVGGGGQLDVDGKGDSDVKLDVEEDERIARQLQEEEDAQRPTHLPPTRVSGSAGEDGAQYGEIPVPIEDPLWSFVEKRRASELQQLREAYVVKISSYPAAQEGFVVIAVEAQSALMLECAQDELIQLLEGLRGSVIVQVLQLGDEEGQRGRQLPPQVGQLFSQLAEGTDAVIDVKNNNITITGPEKAVGECQQKIAAFVQQVQQQGGGMGPGGGRGRGMRLGGGRGGDMDLTSDMSDAEMARYMRTQGMQMPGARGGSDDMMRAMMGGGGMMGGAGSRGGGGPGEYRAFFGMPRGAGSFAPFARNSSDDFGMNRELERGAGVMWPPDQRPSGGLDSLGVGGPIRQGMFDTGQRDRDAEMRPFGGSAGVGEDHMFSDSHPPTEQLAPPGHQQQNPSTEASVDDNRISQESKPRVVRFADEEPAKQPRPPAVASIVHDLRETKMCSVCQHSERDDEPSKSCQHAFCVSCVQQYFTDSQRHCPVCGSDEQQQQHGAATQPDDGVMMVTYDNAFRLPGYETTSRGTIVVSYSFPPGVQKDYQPNPGRKYNGISNTAFFPLSSEGSSVVDLLQRAFDNKQLFALVSTSDGKSEDIVCNGIHHKTNVYGGPQKYGYPDPVYLKRVRHELQAKGFH